MDPHSFIARAEAQRWIGIAEKLLMSHDLVGSKSFAIRAHESDPRLEAAEQILAITETLIAAEKPVVANNGSQQPDYYAILQLARFVSDTEHIAGQYRRLAILLNPNQNRFPYSEQAFQVVNDAWAVLSNPMRKSVYDSELNYMPHQQQQQQQVSNLGFNIDQQHQHQQPHQQQHNFFEQNQQQQQHLQQHNFLGQQVQPFQQNTQQAQVRLQSPPPSAAPQNASYSWPPQSHHQMQEDLKPQVHQLQQLPLHLNSQPHHMKQEQMQHQVPLQQQLQQKQKEQLEQQKKRQQEEEQRRLQEQQLKFQQEEERQRLQEQQKVQQEQEQRRLQEQLRLQEQQRRLKEQEEEQQRQQELQQRRLKEQEEQQRRLKEQEEQQRRLKEQEEEQRRQHELQQRRLKEQEEEQRRQQELQRRLKEQEEEQMRHQQQQKRLQEQLEEQRRLEEKEEEQRRLQEQEEELMRHQQQQQEALRQNATPVQLPRQVNTNNGVTEEEMETEPEPEEETDTADESMDDSPTFWTACPYCFYMYEYPKRYVECTLRCDNCRRAFQAVPVPSPPPTIEGQNAYFYCWGFFPVGVSMSDLQKNNSSKGTKSKWAPFSSLYDGSQNHLNECAAPKENTFVNKNSGPRVSFNDVLNEVSELSDDSDIEWVRTQKKKLKRMSNDMISDFKARVQVLALRAKDSINGNDKNKKNSTQGRVGVPTVPVAETSKKVVGGISSKLSDGVAKESGKLDLNVEFDNHVAAGTHGHEDGEEEEEEEEEEDNIEGIGFFEGLDEFLNNLPILSANEEKVKAT